MNETLQAVERFAPVGLTPPQLLRLPAAVRRAARALARLALYPLRLVTNPQRRFNEAALAALREMTAHIHHLYGRDAHLEGLVTALDRAVKEAGCVLQHQGDIISEHEVALEEHQGVLQEQGDGLQWVKQRVEDHIAHPHPAPTDVSGGLAELQAKLEELRESQWHAVERLRAEHQAAQQQLQQGQQQTADHIRGEQQRALAWAQDEQRREVERVRVELMGERSRVSMLLEEVRRSVPEPLAPRLTERLEDDRRDQNDELYAAFEERFRGSREMIMERQKVYVPLLETAGAGTEERPVLDLGCGRGEWLELLHEHGLHARGVDLNRRFLEVCRERGLEVAEGDALAYLGALPPASVGAVTGFHIVEHLPFAALLRLFDETVRVLKPGGVALFETPNPENITIGACHFFADPTHRQPLYPPTLQFLAEQRGLVRIEVRRLNGHTLDRFRPAEPVETGPVGWGALFECVKHHFLVPPDYAVIGWKV
jgi:O-antigen chain-terminating methyltransferase